MSRFNPQKMLISVIGDEVTCCFCLRDFVVGNINQHDGFDLQFSKIGDKTQDTVTGFLLCGIGDRNRRGQRNFCVVGSDTTLTQIEDAFKELTGRKDVGILLINQHVAEEIRHLLAQYDQALPTILEIPSKNQNYDPDKDDTMIRVKKLLGKA